MIGKASKSALNAIHFLFGLLPLIRAITPVFAISVVCSILYSERILETNFDVSNSLKPNSGIWCKYLRQETTLGNISLLSFSILFIR